MAITHHRRTKRRTKRGGLFVDDTVATALAAVGAYALLSPMVATKEGGKRKKSKKSKKAKKGRKSRSRRRSSRH